MNRIAPFFLVFMLPATLALGVELGGLWTIVPLVITFGMIPLFDALLDQDQVNPDEAVGHRWVFDVPLLAWVPVQLLTTIYVLWRLSSGDFSALEIAGSVASLGVLNGAGGINIAHELMHRKHPLHRAAAEVLMTCVSYTHFCVEHVLGHHRHVATPLDSASSRLGEGFYRFYLRTVFGSLRSAWGLERGRCAQRDIAWWSLRDRRTRYALVLTAVYAGIYLSMGSLALGLFIVHGVIAFSLLEAINYVEHYGLARQRLASGKYERVRPEHSWNSAHRVSNYFLFNLARHSDHHYLASREYDRLRHHAAVPQLPSGYATMVILALVPPLWFRVMDHRVQAWNAHVGQARQASVPVTALSAEAA
ncbi:Alkane-1 monooxygenase [Enhygromyxa salina]|uniref:Alkane-1 monooxygenase n=1 Tax=Enhygromyxa salina TaxID=215803 RepID=A0A0C1Z2Y2_9BACT|nr:alkane 1-monooxygenase [Enhygromyxa salina]KIG11894.1 Alkane-1 monooxygenase [Enhygromyxa salina]